MSVLGLGGSVALLTIAAEVAGNAGHLTVVPVRDPRGKDNAVLLTIA